MIDVLCVGNALIDSFLILQDASEYCRVDSKTGELCIKHGQKIPLDSAAFVLGGNACNISVGIARLGLKSSLVAELGNDAFAHNILFSLRDENVNTSHIIKSDASSSFAVGINYKKERTLFVEHVERRHAFVFDMPKPKWVYLTSLGHEWKGAYKRTLAFVKETGAKLAFNPGSLQFKDGVSEFSDVLLQTDLVFVNKEEAGKIAKNNEQKADGEAYEEYMKSLLQSIKETGPKMVVLTDGEKGSFVLDEEGVMRRLAIVPCAVIERTGAGDAYATGFLGGRLYGRSVAEAMQWGALNAASVIGATGAQKGLLSHEEIERQLRTDSVEKPKNI